MYDTTGGAQGAASTASMIERDVTSLLAALRREVTGRTKVGPQETARF